MLIQIVKVWTVTSFICLVEKKWVFHSEAYPWETKGHSGNHRCTLGHHLEGK